MTRLTLGTFSIGILLAACGGDSPPAEPAMDEPMAGTMAPPAAEPADQGSAAVPTLTQLWVTEGLNAPEGAVLLDDGRILVSNVASGTDDQDGTGYLSMIDAEDGSIVDERWAEGLDRPFGMAVTGSTLYVSDRTVLRTYDLETGDAGTVIAVQGAEDLNDVTVWQGSVFVSDPGGNAIHRVVGDTTEVWLQGPQLDGVNGILGDGDTLLIAGATDAFARADANGEITIISPGFDSGDGIGILADGGHLVTNWRGEIRYVSPEGESTILVDTREAEIEQNDLSVYGDLVIVPNWSGNSLTVWRVSW